jgi:hypothetical protein
MHGVLHPREYMALGDSAAKNVGTDADVAT